MGEYFSVTEYAKRTGKDPGNIRRMLISGDLPGEKIGRQWAIPKSAVCPEDKRVTSGKYRNWRKQLEVARNNPELIRSLKQMCAKLSGVYGDSLEKIVLYGSYARGEQTEESDVDVALVLREKETEAQYNLKVDLVVDYELEHDVVLSTITIEIAHFEEWRRVLPFYKNIEKDGITLWQAV